MKPNLRSAVNMRAETVGHSHPDIAPGTGCLIERQMEDGYVVKITGMWQVAGSDRGEQVKETRSVWMAADSLTLVL